MIRRLPLSRRWLASRRRLLAELARLEGCYRGACDQLRRAGARIGEHESAARDAITLAESALAENENLRRLLACKPHPDWVPRAEIVRMAHQLEQLEARLAEREGAS